MLKKVLTFILAVLLALPLSAQKASAPAAAVDSSNYDNPYKIPNELYEIFMRARKVRASDECLAIADTMLAKAKEMGDRKSECLALTLPVQRAYAIMDYEKMTPAAEKLRKVALESGYTQYYYYANNQEINLLMSKNRFVEAKERIDEMFRVVRELDDNYGLASCYMLSGTFFRYRLNNEAAAKEYLQGAKIIEESVPEQTPSSYYLRAAEVLFRDKEYSRMLQYADKALEFYTDVSTRIMIQDCRARALYYLGRKAEVLKACDEIDQLQESGGKVSKEHLYYYKVFREMAKGDYDAALKQLKFDRNGLDSHAIASDIYAAKGNYKSALEESQLLNLTIRGAANRTMDEDIGFMSDRLYNEKLQVENAELELEHQKIRSRMVLIIAISGTSILVIVFMFLFFGYRRRHKEERERMNFLVDLGHSLRTPLTLVMGPLPKVIGSSSVDIDSRERLTKVYRQARRMKTIINTFLAVADLKKGTAKPHLVMTSVNDWVSEQIDIFSEESESFGITVNKDLDAKVTEMEMDPDMYSIIFANILTVSLRDNISLSPVLVSTSRSSEGVCVTISTSGVEVDNYINDTSNTGNALALRYSKILAQQQGGRLDIEKRQDGGSSISFIIA